MSVALRIIPCLDVDAGRVVKGVNFENLRDAGDPVELARRYGGMGADEITFLDVSASVEGRATMLDVVSATAEQVFVPLTVGGGVRSVDDVARLLAHGADASQILEEPQASNTRENLLFSAKLAEEAGFDTSRVLIVTSDFHMCRAKYIARTLGMEPYGLSSGTWPWILKLNYTLREVFAFCKAVYQAHH